jgi:hypothetical protein
MMTKSLTKTSTELVVLPQLIYFDFNSTRTNEVHSAFCNHQPVEKAIKIGPFNSADRLEKYLDQVGLPLGNAHNCTGIDPKNWQDEEDDVLQTTFDQVIVIDLRQHDAYQRSKVVRKSSASRKRKRIHKGKII